MYHRLIDKLTHLSALQIVVFCLVLALPVTLYLTATSAWLALLLVLIYCLCLAIILSSITQILLQVKDAATHLSEGDLTQRIAHQPGVTPPIYHTINRIGSDISRTIHALGKSTKHLLDVADTVQKDSQESKSGAIGQKQDVDKAEIIIRELSDITHQVSDHCETTATVANQAKRQADQGTRDMIDLENALDSANQHIDNSNTHFESLMAETAQISQVMETISGIAEQTNLLALNAAIESARAGEQGRGFAVVADEVRNLAMRTQEATEEIRTKITNLQNKTDDVMQTMQENKSSMLHSLEIASTAENTFKALNEQIEEIQSLGKQIAASSEQQTAQTNELSQCLDLIASESENNVKSTQETLIASITVRNLSGEIDSLLHRFAINPHQVEQEDGRRDRLMDWSDNLDIGIEEINRQHQTLLHLVNELHHLLHNNYGLASIKRVVQGLIDYTANHFTYEETLFDQVEYSQNQQHKEKHKKLVKEVLEFQRRVEKGEEVGDELMQFLKNWLVQHIMREDKAYADEFKHGGIH